MVLVVKNPPASAGDIRDAGSILSRKIPWRRARQPTPIFLSGEFHGQRSLAGYSPQGCQRVGHNLMTKQQQCSWASLLAQLVKNLPAMQENWVHSLGWEDPLEKGKATHSSILAWRIPWTVYSPWGRKELDMTERLHLRLNVYLYRVK